MFDDDVRRIVDHLRSGVSVEVVGQRGMGRTSVCRRVVDDLLRSGAAVVSLAGVTGPLAEPFGGLRLAGVETPKQGPSLHGFADALGRELVGAQRRCLVLDDLPAIDDESLSVVTIVRERLQVPLLITSLPFRRGVTPLHRWFPAELGVRVTLDPLSYEETSALVHRLLGGGVASETVAHVYAKSSGITSLVGTIVRTAVLSRRLVEIDGVWCMSGETLWNPHLLPVVEQFLAGLDDQEYQTAYELALLGSATLEQIEGIGRVSVVERLEERGLVSVAGDQSDKALVSLNPLVIVDYFRVRPLDVAGMVRSSELSRLLDIPESQLFHAARRRLRRWADAPDLTLTETGDLGLLSRYFTDRAVLDRVAHEERLAADGTLANVLAYLDAILGWKDDGSGTVDRLFEETDQRRVEGTPDEFLLYGLVKACWSALVRRDARLVAETLDWLRGTGAHEADVRAIATLLRVLCERVRPVDLTDLNEELDRRPESWIVRLAFVAAATIHGDHARALAALERVPPGVPAMVGRFLEFFRVLALIDGGDQKRAWSIAVRSLREAEVDLDRPGVTLFAYTAALRCYIEGRWEEGVRLLSEVFTLGSPSVLLRGVHTATLRLGALLMFRTGRRDVASSLLREAEDRGDGPLPWMQRLVGEAVQRLMEGELDGTAEVMARLARETGLRGQWLVTLHALQVAASLDPSRERLDALDRACDSSPDPGAMDDYRLLLRQLLDDPENASQHVGAYHLGRDDHFVLRALDRLAEREAPDAGPITAARQRFARLTGHRPAGGPIKVPLTPREREIALLARELTNAEIGKLLVISPRTVENHIFRALRKTGASSRGDLARMLGAPHNS